MPGSRAGWAVCGHIEGKSLLAGVGRGVEAGAWGRQLDVSGGAVLASDGDPCFHLRWYVYLGQVGCSRDPADGKGLRATSWSRAFGPMH